MKFSEFFAAVKHEGLEVEFDHPYKIEPVRLDNEAMFHLPLIAITVLMLAKGRSKPRVDILGQLVGECFEQTFSGFRGSAQHLGWSAALRLRTVQALTFLEASGLVVVKADNKSVVATEDGQRVIQAALRASSDLSVALYNLDRSYRNIRIERQLRLVLT